MVDGSMVSRMDVWWMAVWYTRTVMGGGMVSWIGGMVSLMAVWYRGWWYGYSE